ncbi:MAG: DNA-binding transcriptional MocR family regulator [Chlamydiales bacterium]|jgi:DNA-binding transcriptional MocR family regulator
MWPTLPPKPSPCGSKTLASWIQRDIGRGVLKTGEKLPPQRAIASRLGIAIGTVTRAYAIARRQGWIVTRVGDGSFVRASGWEPGGAGDAVDFSRNDPIPIPAEREALAQSLHGLARRPAELDTTLGSGDDSILERVKYAGAQLLAGMGWGDRADCIVPGASTQHALLVLLGSVMRRGETLLCEEIVLPGVRSLARNLGIPLVSVESDEHGPLPDALDAACAEVSPRAFYTTPTVHPLTGRTVSAQRRTELAAVARRRDIALIEDVDDGLLLEDPPPTFGSLAPERSFLLVETSKSFCSGGRVCLIAAPPEYVAELENGMRSSIWSVAALPALITAEWIEDGTAEKLMRARRLEIRARQEAARDALTGFEVSLQPGSPHIWMAFPDEFPLEAAIERATAQGTPVTDAGRFCMPDVRAPHGLRICLANATRDGTLERGLGKLAGMLRRPLTPRADVF